jgi:3-phenylpropionate/cinnamic acid dioxygenase small subunit
MSATAVSGELRHEVEALQHAYVRTVDGMDMTQWPAHFAAEASYVVTTRENVERGLGIALVLDGSRDRIEDRVTYITKVWDGHYNAYWPRHVIGPTVITGRSGDDLELETPVAVYITEPDEIGSRLLAVGVYHDVVTFEDGAARFRSKHVVLDTSVLPRYFVYPL